MVIEASKKKKVSGMSRSLHFIARVLLSVALLGVPTLIYAQSEEAMPGDQDVFEWMQEQYLNVEITTASLATETLLDAPAPMYVLTRQDIQNRGYIG